MERLRERLRLADKALATLREVPTIDVDHAAKRDIAIMRFTYTFEATWKAAQEYLTVAEGVVVKTPKASIRGSRDAGLLTDEETAAALAMADDRNLTVHTYDEDLAERVYVHVSGHTSLMDAWLKAMEARLGGASQSTT